MFYSPDSKLLTKNIPYKLIYDEQDIIDLGKVDKKKKSILFI